MQSLQMVQLFAAMVAAGIPVEAMPVPRSVPVRQRTEADAERIAAAKAKRDRKAKKRASKTAKQVE